MRTWNSKYQKRRSATVRFPWQLHVLGTVFHQSSKMRHHLCRSGAAWRHRCLNWRWRNTDFSQLHFVSFVFTIKSVKCPRNVTHDSVTLISAWLTIKIIINNYDLRTGCNRKPRRNHQPVIPVPAPRSSCSTATRDGSRVSDRRVRLPGRASEISGQTCSTIAISK